VRDHRPLRLPPLWVELDQVLTRLRGKWGHADEGTTDGEADIEVMDVATGRDRGR
jgi:hypothetical protein